MHVHRWTLVVAFTMLLAATGQAQGNRTLPPLKDLFELSVIQDGDESYLNLAPDSTPGDAELNRRCTAMWPYLMYLFENRSNTASTMWKLEKFLPDTSFIQSRIDSSFNADTAFASIYIGALTKAPVAPLSIDSALRIAAHFFYLHGEDGAPIMHICVGINKVNDLSASSAHPYHAAFCYQAIWEMEDYFFPITEQGEGTVLRRVQGSSALGSTDHGSGTIDLRWNGCTAGIATGAHRHL